MASHRSNPTPPAVALLTAVLLLAALSLVLPLSADYDYDPDRGRYFYDNYMADDAKGVIRGIDIVLTAWLAIVAFRERTTSVRRLIWPFGVLGCLPVAVAFGVVQGDIRIGGVVVVLESLLRVATVPVLVLASRRGGQGIQPVS